MSTVQSEIEKRFEIHVKQHPGHLLQHLNSARKERRLCDFVIKVGSRKIHAHRIILSEGCDYFRGMFAHGMKESESGVVEMKGVGPECMVICIEYIYTGQVSVLESDLPELLQAAQMLQLPWLCGEIASLLQTALDADSFFATRNVAITFDLKGLKEHCDKYAMEKFNLIAAKEAFKDLEKEYVQFLVGAKNTKASEPLKCKTLLSWAAFDTKNRSKVFEEIFQSMDLKKIPATYRLFLSQKEPLVSESTICLKKLFQSMAGVGEVTMKDFSDEVESQCNAITVFDQISKSLQAFKPADKSWTRLHVITDEIINKYLTAVTLDADVIVAAYDKTNYRLKYADAEPKWTRLPDRSETGCVAAVALRGQVYAFHDCDPSCVTIETLNTRQTSWSQLTKPFPCCNAAVIAVGDFLYTFGGYDGEVLSKVAKFDPSTETWSNLPSMHTARYAAAAAALDDRIYIIGGHSDAGPLTTAEYFHIQSRVWTTVKPMSNAHYLFNACTVDGKIYAVGGQGSRNLIDEFNPDTETWKTVATITGKDILDKATISLSV